MRFSKIRSAFLLLVSIASLGATSMLCTSAFAGCLGDHGRGSAPELSDDEVLSLLRKSGFPKESEETMLCIAKAESGKYPEAYCNDPTSGSTYAYGLFQMQKLWFKQCSNSTDLVEQVKRMGDPLTNTKCARRAYLWAKNDPRLKNPYKAWEVYAKLGACHGLDSRYSE